MGVGGGRYIKSHIHAQRQSDLKKNERDSERQTYLHRRRKTLIKDAEGSRERQFEREKDERY